MRKTKMTIGSTEGESILEKLIKKIPTKVDPKKVLKQLTIMLLFLVNTGYSQTVTFEKQYLIVKSSDNGSEGVVKIPLKCYSAHLGLVTCFNCEDATPENPCSNFYLDYVHHKLYFVYKDNMYEIYSPMITLKNILTNLDFVKMQSLTNLDTE